MAAPARPPGRDFIDTERALAVLGQRVDQTDQEFALEKEQARRRGRTDRILMWATFCSSLALGAVVLFAANQDSEGIATETFDAGLMAATQQQSSELRGKLNQTNERLVQLGLPPISTDPNASPNQILLDTIIATARVDQAEGRMVNGGVAAPLTLNDLPALAEEAMTPEQSTDSSNAAPAAQTPPATQAPAEEPAPAPAAEPAPEPEQAPDPAPTEEPAQDPEPTTSEPPASNDAPAQESAPADDSEPDNSEPPLVSVNVDEVPIIGDLLG